MQTTFFKYAFIALMGIAMLGVTATATTVMVLGLKIIWSWLRANGKTAKIGQT